jgi:hypothetical protein
VAAVEVEAYVRERCSAAKSFPASAAARVNMGKACIRWARDAT